MTKSNRFCTYYTACATFHPIKGKIKANSDVFADASRAFITLNVEWLTALSVPFVIIWNDNFDFGFATLLKTALDNWNDNTFFY